MGYTKKRPSTSLQSEPPKEKNFSIAVSEIRYDGKEHYPGKTTKTQAYKCHNLECKSRTIYICKKCDTPVCQECIEDF